MRALIAKIFALFGWIAPGLAGGLALRFFLRPSGKSRPRPWEETDSLITAPELERFQWSSGEVQAYRWRATHAHAPKALLVHGWNSDVTAIVVVAQALLEQGYEVLGIDLPAHGQSTGRELTMLTAVESIAACSAHEDGFDLIVGHSFGGAAVLLACSELLLKDKALKPGALVTVAAPSRLSGVAERFKHMLKLPPGVGRAFEQRLQQRSPIAFEDFDIDQQQSPCPLPVFIIHDRDDDNVPCEDSELAAHCLPNAQLHITQGMGHSKVLRDPETAQRIVEFVNSV